MAVTDEVGRLFRRLVEVLARSGHDRLLDPIDFSDLYEKIIPYRAHRSVLRFDTNQDYEMALLRLLSGEQGYVEVEPADVAEALATEAKSVNPNPAAFRAFGAAKVRLSFRAVKDLMDSETPYAPPVPPSPQVEQAQPPPPVRERHWRRPRPLPFMLESDTPARAPAAVPAGGGECPQCSGALPAGRVVNFCPHCGGDVKVRDCPECGTGLDLEWRHCISCGHRVG